MQKITYKVEKFMKTEDWHDFYTSRQHPKYTLYIFVKMPLQKV